MRIIVGLGNPGASYASTRHNVGFLAVDALAVDLHAEEWRSKSAWNAEIAEATHEGERVLLVKPQTYMNRSGDAVKTILAATPATQEDVLVIYDDADLPLGDVRLKKEGGSAGQKGMQSILSLFPNQEVARIRVGIGRPDHPDHALEDWVLGRWSPDEEAALPAMLEKITQTTLTFLSE